MNAAFGGQGTCQEGQDAAAVEDAEDQENAKSKAYWVDEEETVLTQKYGRLRQAGVMCGVATWTRKFEGVADTSYAA
ncbi:TPA: hypothetical protein ACH3X3_007997 [Trebouxia sp. C0006]